MTTFTLVHVVLSLIGIGSGLVVLFGMLFAKQLDGWTIVFLTTTLATSLTGFFFPFIQFTPAHGLGIASLVVLAVVLLARYSRGLAGPWRLIYSIGATSALYMNVFVGVVQAFRHVPALNALAPTESEPPFLIAQLGVLILFVALGIAAGRRFRAAPVSASQRASAPVH